MRLSVIFRGAVAMLSCSRLVVFSAYVSCWGRYERGVVAHSRPDGIIDKVTRETAPNGS